MNLGDIDFGLENWPTDEQIQKELDEHENVFIMIHPAMSFGHAITGFCDIIKVPVEWLHFDSGWNHHIKVKPEHFGDMNNLLNKEVDWLCHESHSWQAERLEKKQNVNELFWFEMVTTDTLRMILNKFDCHVMDAEKARDDFKEFTGLS